MASIPSLSFTTETDFVSKEPLMGTQQHFWIPTHVWLRAQSLKARLGIKDIVSTSVHYVIVDVRIVDFWWSYLLSI